MIQDVIDEAIEKGESAPSGAQFLAKTPVSESDQRVAVELAIVASLTEGEEFSVRDVIASVSRAHPASEVRRAYWELVSKGTLVLTSSGRVRLA